MTPKWSSCQATIKRVVLIAKTRLLLVVSVAIHTIGQILILLLLYIFFYYLKLNVTFINVLTMDVSGLDLIKQPESEQFPKVELFL